MPISHWNTNVHKLSITVFLNVIKNLRTTNWNVERTHNTAWDSICTTEHQQACSDVELVLRTENASIKKLNTRKLCKSQNTKIYLWFNEQVSIIICLLTARLRVRAMMPAFVALYTGLNGLTFRPAKITKRNNLKLLVFPARRGKWYKSAVAFFPLAKLFIPLSSQKFILSELDKVWVSGGR